MSSKSSSPPKPLTSWTARDSIMSRVQIQLTTEATHFLESQDRHHEQGPNTAHHGNHSLPGQPRTAIMSRVQCSTPPKLLTSWTAKDSHREQVQIQFTTEATHILE